MSALRAVWIDEGTDPQDLRAIVPGSGGYARLKDGGFTHLYRSARDPLTTIAALDEDRRHGFTCGIYWPDTWDAELTGTQAARLMNGHWSRLGGASKRLDVQFDVERHDSQYVLALFAEWRRLRPYARTSWTMEGFQGGWAVELLSRVKADPNLLLVPQCYAGDMTPFDPYGVVRDLTDVGFPLERVVPFYDAARLYRGWAGFAFSSGRLP